MPCTNPVWEDRGFLPEADYQYKASNGSFVCIPVIAPLFASVDSRSKPPLAPEPVYRSRPPGMEVALEGLLPNYDLDQQCGLSPFTENADHAKAVERRLGYSSLDNCEWDEG